MTGSLAKILIVDDEPTSVFTLKSILENNSELVFATTAQEARQQIVD